MTRTRPWITTSYVFGLALLLAPVAAHAKDFEKEFKKWRNEGMGGITSCYADLTRCWKDYGDTKEAVREQKVFDGFSASAGSVSKAMRGLAGFGKSDEKRYKDFMPRAQAQVAACKSGLDKCRQALETKRKTLETGREVDKGRVTEERAKHVEDLARTPGAGAPTSSVRFSSGISFWRRQRTGQFAKGYTFASPTGAPRAGGGSPTAELPRATSASALPGSTPAAPTPPSTDPRVVVTIPRGAPLMLANPPANDAETTPQFAVKSPALRIQRMREFQARDAEELGKERLGGPMPTSFCAGSDKCFTSLNSVVVALYGASATGSGASALPVFCAPRPLAASAGKEASAWDHSRVYCSADWISTLGGWKPWTEARAEDGTQRLVAAKAPEPGVIPPFACFGNSSLANSAVLPVGTSSGGFTCRRRIFRVLATDASMSQADENRAVVNMCTEMRQQVWAEKYQNINAEYQTWCRSDADRVRKGVCAPPPPASEDAAAARPPALPFMRLSREELLYFFGHRELYCRGDRPGLTHFLFNDSWADTFTCGVARGLLEAGPFEEGVQACAISPYVGRPGKGGALSDNETKSRLHCWQFSRPTCEEVSISKSKQEEIDSLHRSNVFDSYDAFREYRRTQNKEVLELYDLKDSEKVRDFGDLLGFSDNEKDEGTLDVREFCRFVGDTSKIICGYGKASMAAWYEARKDETPAGCDSGVCARGAFQRGYACAIFASPKFFDGRAQWVCGIDTGSAGERLMRNASAVCVGGARARAFQSARGDSSSLQCYERRFKWAESQGSVGIAARQSVVWADAIDKAAQSVARDGEKFFDPWLAGGQQSIENRKRILEDKQKAIAAKDAAGVRRGNDNLGQLVGWWETAIKRLRDDWAADTRELVNWAEKRGHTLGHRASAGKLLIGSSIKAIVHLKKLKGMLGLFARGYPAGRSLTFTPYGSSDRRGMSLKTESDSDDANEKKRFEVLTKDGLAQLGDLIDEVTSGSRAADDKWYGELRSIATEDGMLRILPEHFAILLRVHHMFEVIERARTVVLSEAKTYYDAVMAASRARPLLSRLEAHEKARTTALPGDLEGRIFCVAAQGRFTATGRTEYICASSPLLVAGAVESMAKAPLQAGGPMPTPDEQQKRRAEAKTDWCYGGVEGRPVFGAARPAIVQGANLSSPFEMAVPESVCSDVDKSSAAAKGREPICKGRAKSSANWLKCTGFQYSDLDWVKATGGARSLRMAAARGEEAGGASPEEVKRLEETARTTNAAAQSAKGAVEEVKRQIAQESAKLSKRGVSAQQVTSTINSLKGRLVDLERKAVDAVGKAERAAQELLAKGRRAIGAVRAGVDTAIGVGDKAMGAVSGAKETAEKGKEVLAKVSGILTPLINLVAPKLGQAMKSIESMAHAGLNFLQEWAGKIEDIVRPVWEKVKLWASREGDGGKILVLAEEVISKAEQALADVKEKAFSMYKEAKEAGEKVVGDIRGDIEKGIEKAAGAVGAAKEKAAAELSALREKLKEKGRAAVETVKAKEKEGKDLANRTRKLLTDAQGNLKKQVLGFGKIVLEKAAEWLGDAAAKKVAGFFDQMLEDLMKLISSRVMDTLEPQVRNLLAQGFKFVRSVLGPVAKAIIGALAAIPFAGAALAPMGQLLYDMGMDKLESLAFDLLRGVVERFFGKTVRGLLAKALKAMEKQMKSLLTASCAKLGVGEICKAFTKVKLFAQLPERSRWLARALACTERELIDNDMHRRAYAARWQIQRIGNEMRRDAVQYARVIADQQLAKYGLSVEALVAYKRGGGPRELVAAVETANAGLVRDVAAERASVRLTTSTNGVRRIEN